MTIDLLERLESPAAPDELEPIRQARAFLHGEVPTPGPLPDEVADALIDLLVSRQEAGRLAALAAGADKALGKRARRGLHHLRARGIHVEVPRPAAAAAPALVKEPEPPSALSSWMRDGEHVVMYGRLSPGGGITAFQAQVEEARGLVEFRALNPSRKNWRNLVHDLFGHEDVIFAPIDGATARWLIAEAVRRTAEAGHAPPREYLEAQQLLGPVTPLPRHPAYDLVPESAIAAAAADPARFGAVLEMPEARSWVIEGEFLRKAALEMEGVLTSRLILDQRQRAQQVIEAVRRVVREALAGPLRDRLARRFLDTALVIAGRATVSRPGRDYLGDAALAVAAARQVADPTVPADDIIVARRLFERLIAALLSIEGPKRARDDDQPLIVLPPSADK